jgi:hypothetical protein
MNQEIIAEVENYSTHQPEKATITLSLNHTGKW